MKSLTIFTPAYNRAHTLERTYESLCHQTCDDFEWLIVDDGSTDNTRSLVESWIKDNKITIRYIFQENQGMHGAHNTAYANIYTELNVCIDSDDWMPYDAVEKILNFWEVNKTDDVAGIIGLDYTPDGKLIGNDFKDSKISYWDYLMGGGKGDKKFVYRTDIIKKYPPYPIFPNEKYVSLASLYFMIDKNYPLLTLNTCLVYVDYQEDGSSLNMYRNYINNPKGFIYDRKLVLSYPQPLKVKIKYNIHYIANKLIGKEIKSIISDSPTPLWTILTLPFGYLWYKIIVSRSKRDIRIKLRH